MDGRREDDGNDSERRTRMADRGAYERFGWLFSGGLLATRPAVRAIERLMAVLTEAIALTAGKGANALQKPRNGVAGPASRTGPSMPRSRRVSGKCIQGDEDG